jgi:cytochrome c
VQVKLIFKFTLIFVGIALLFAALFFERRPAAPFHPQLSTAVPTPDRLAKPTLPASPSQADYGAQVYWLSCLPCHGDRGQGLTDEFREVYPPEDRNCWNSGCHGKRPYQNGFTLPTKIPALVGQGALQKFPTAANLHGYIFAAMPFWKPGSLTEEESWQVTAFLLRQNGLWQGTKELNESNAGNVKLPPGGLPFTAHPKPADQNKSSILIGGGLIGLLTAIILGVLILKKSRNTTTI